MAVALVTGASSGIGLATAVVLARGGHAVIATMRNLNGAGELRKIVSEEKLPVEVAALNVDDDASVSDAIGKALAERGHIDVLVNNAGIGGGGLWKRFRWISSANIIVYRNDCRTARYQLACV
jgi:NAD(P)-dependent dehydrogenase (short-subunit alcohol dehydrogenase family)